VDNAEGRLLRPAALQCPIHRRRCDAGRAAQFDIYWDRNDDTRAFAQRFWKRNGKPPAETHAVNYSAVTQYLKAIKTAGTKDTDSVLKALHDLPVSDPITPTGTVRKDGRLIRPTWLVRAKKPGDVKEKWDCLEIVSEIPGEQAYKPVSESACSLLKA
jgi:branched-chain amino acid transport system substrate-binding protein